MQLKSRRYHLELDGTTIAKDLIIMLGAASEFTGGGIPIAPEARSVPGEMNVLYASNPGKPAAVGLLLKALGGKHLANPKVQNLFAKGCRVSTETDDFWASLVYGDGEYLGDLPAHLKIGEKPLRVLIPNERVGL